MTIFPVAKVNSLRYLADEAYYEPEAGDEGWSKSTADPMKLLAVFDALWLKEDFVLRAYQFRAGGNGNGIIWAMPTDAPFPDPTNCSRFSDGFLETPKPPEALDEIMDAIAGDGTPWSYLSASLLAREAAEFGAMWHGCNWSTHTILGADPWSCEPKAKDRRKRQPLASGHPDSWNWNEPMPETWEPAFVDTGECKSVSFFTFSGLGQDRIYGFTDLYAHDNYRFETQEKVLADGPGGYIF